MVDSSAEGSDQLSLLRRQVEDQKIELDRLRAELGRISDQAKAASADRTRFFAAASHDLLQPLNAARLYTSTLAERARGGDLESVAGSIQASLAAVEEILSALLDISRLESGVSVPDPTDFPVRDLLQKVVVEFTPAARQKDIRLVVVSSSAVVHTDWVMAGRIVQNLVSNAIKYTAPGGHVLVGIRRVNGRARLDVIDTGIGIAPGQQDLIFSEFTRLDAGARVARGVGLGLSIVRRLVTTLGLTLDVASAPGKGSRFSVMLGRATRQPELPSAVAAPTHAGDSIAARVLCIDNEPAILDGMTSLLSAWGCDVRTAQSLKALVDKAVLDRWSPDLILMDYHLDEASGLDAIEWLRQTLGAHIPSALITADRSQTVAKLAAARGVPILQKPIKPAALRALLASIVTPDQPAEGRLPST